MSDAKPLEVVFKTVDGLDISMDVYIPPGASKDRPAPILLWWHGGGLLQGTRKAVSPHTLSAPAKHNLCVVSADYRLAPQTRLPDILSDCRAAITFILSPAFAQVTQHRADPDNLFLSGSSAGGFVALLCGTGIGFEASGLALPPPVRGIIPLYPITDLLDRFWTTKQSPVSYMDRVIETDEVKDFVNPETEKTTSSTVDGKRSIFYHYMVQEAILSSLLLDGTNVPPSAFSVPAGIRSRSFSPPPVYLIHGNDDGKVPHRQSVDVADALKAIGAEVEYHEFEGLDHGFERDEKYGMEDMYKWILALVK